MRRVDVYGYFIEAGQQLEVCNMGGGRQRSGQGRAGQGARRGEAERARDSGCLAWAAWADRQTAGVGQAMVGGAYGCEEWLTTPSLTLRMETGMGAPLRYGERHALPAMRHLHPHQPWNRPSTTGSYRASVLAILQNTSPERRPHTVTLQRRRPVCFTRVQKMRPPPPPPIPLCYGQHALPTMRHLHPHQPWPTRSQLRSLPSIRPGLPAYQSSPVCPGLEPLTRTSRRMQSCREPRCRAFTLRLTPSVCTIYRFQFPEVIAPVHRELEPPLFKPPPP